MVNGRDGERRKSKWDDCGGEQTKQTIQQWPVVPLGTFEIRQVDAYTPAVPERKSGELWWDTGSLPLSRGSDCPRTGAVYGASASGAA